MGKIRDLSDVHMRDGRVYKNVFLDEENIDGSVETTLRYVHGEEIYVLTREIDRVVRDRVKGTVRLLIREGTIVDVTLTDGLYVDYVDYSDVTSEYLYVFQRDFENVEGVEDEILNYAVANDHILLEKDGDYYRVLSKPSGVYVSFNYV